MTRFQFTKFGLKHDPRGAHVTFDYLGRNMIGAVAGCKRNEVTGAITLQVKYFNGEDWPIEPVAMAVNVLERN